MTLTDVQFEARRAWVNAFTAAQSKFTTIEKTKTVEVGNKYTYSYADLVAVTDAVKPALHENGLSYSQSAMTGETGRIGVETRIYHVDGWVEVFGPLLLEAAADAKAAGSAVTYARRYALAAALGIVTDEDVDAQHDNVVELKGGDKWLAEQVQELALWTPDRSREVFHAIMREKQLQRPLSKANAQLVFDAMKKAYDRERSAASSDS